MTFVITAGGLDLSVGSMAAFIAGLMITRDERGLLPTFGDRASPPCLRRHRHGAMVASASSAGAVNGLARHHACRIEAFIVTLGTMGIYRSLVTWLADGGTLSLDFGTSADVIYGPVYLRRHPRGELADHRLRRGGDRWARSSMRRTSRSAAIAAADRLERAPWRATRLGPCRTGCAPLTYVLLGLLVGVATVMYVPRLGSASSSHGAFYGSSRRSPPSSSAARC